MKALTSSGTARKPRRSLLPLHRRCRCGRYSGRHPMRCRNQHHLRPPASVPNTCGRCGLVVEDGIVGVFPSERFPPLDPILRVLLAEEKRHARLPRFLGLIERCRRPRSRSSSNRPIISFGICRELVSSSSMPLSNSRSRSSPANAAFIRAAIRASASMITTERRSALRKFK
jgi:hypothetical protein